MAVSLKMNPGGKGTGDRADQFVTDPWSGTRTQLVRLAARLKEGKWRNTSGGAGRSDTENPCLEGGVTTILQRVGKPWSGTSFVLSQRVSRPFAALVANGSISNGSSKWF